MSTPPKSLAPATRSGHDPPMTDAPAPSLLRTALFCRCPRCGEGRLFAGFLVPAPRCEACDLDYRFVDSGDGPAVFVILVVGFVVVAAALVTEVKYSPPYWVHAVLWLPAILGLSLGLLRPSKAAMIGLQFRHEAREARLPAREPRR